MEVIRKNEENKGSFFIEESGEKLAEITYVWVGTDKFIIDHSEVSDRLKGQGAGRRMLEAAVEFAREMDLKIIPLCPFAKSVFKKSVELRDVL